MVLPETARSSAPLLEAAIWEERATGASGTRLKVATRPAAVGTTWLDLFHPGTPSELTLEARVRVVADVAGALIQIHENSGVPRPHRRHGRLTPRHVLVSVDGSASLFNVKEPFSKLLPPQPDLGYLAPELLTQTGPATQQSDVFGLGVLLWEALDNGRLFPHRRAEAISRLIARRSLPSPRATEEWALPLSDVALRALLPDPGERHADATAFWLALREHLPPPDGARGVLSRLVQRALKLELTSEIRESPPYLLSNRFPGASQPPLGSQLGPESAEPPARYSLHPEPSTRRLTVSIPPLSTAPGGLGLQDPAWLLSDPPALALSLAPAPHEVFSPAVPSAVAARPAESLAPASPPLAAPSPASSPTSSAPVSRIEATRQSRAPISDAPLGALQVNLQREVVDGSIPFFVTSPPPARPFPWGALSFAALIFFGVGAAVAFGAVTALRAPRPEATHEINATALPTAPHWAAPEKLALPASPTLDNGKPANPAPSSPSAPSETAAPLSAPAALESGKLPQPLPRIERAATPPISEATLTTKANEEAEAADELTNPSRPAPHRVVKPVKHKRPAASTTGSTPGSTPDPSAATEPAPEAPPEAEPAPGSDLTESLPFVKQPY